MLLLPACRTSTIGIATKTLRSYVISSPVPAGEAWRPNTQPTSSDNLAEASESIEEGKAIAVSVSSGRSTLKRSKAGKDKESVPSSKPPNAEKSKGKRDKWAVSRRHDNMA